MALQDCRVLCPDGDTCGVAGVLERVEAPVMRHAAQHQFARRTA